MHSCNEEKTALPSFEGKAVYVCVRLRGCLERPEPDVCTGRNPARTLGGLFGYVLTRLIFAVGIRRLRITQQPSKFRADIGFEQAHCHIVGRG